MKSVLAILLVAAPAFAADAAPKPTYSQVRAIFAQHCLSCHDSKEQEGGLILETHQTLLKGGDSGPVIIPGKSGESILVVQIEHTKKPFMPPPKKGDKLSPQEIAIIRAWIDAGAPAPQAGETIAATQPVFPKITPKVAPPRSIYSAAYAPSQKLLAISRDGNIELISPESRGLIRRIEAPIGRINDVSFSTDGTLIAAAGGQPGQLGQARVWKSSTGELVKSFDGHKDAMYAVAISPNNQTLATGSYDQKIILWDIAQGKPIQQLDGHNGAVTDLSFRPDGKVLASVSADRTLKLWEVAGGKRLDTFSESLKDLNAVAFSSDGKRVAAGGVDNRIRIWNISAAATEGTNSIQFAQFAHEGAILRLAWSADGKTIISSADNKTVKVWNSETMTPRLALPNQADWPTALALVSDDKAAAVGRLDGAINYYDIATGKIIPPPKPEITALEPRGMQRGQTIKLKITGKNLATATNIKTSEARLAGKLLPDDAGRADFLWAEITAPADLAPASYDISITTGGGTSTAQKLVVDTIPQIIETEPNDSPTAATAASAASGNVGVSFWGKFDRRGDADCFAFDAAAGQTVVFDAAAQRIGSKADVVLTLLDQTGRVLASSNHFDNDADPLLAHTFQSPGRYIIRATDLLAGASGEHFYRLSVGPFAYVTAVHPIAVTANSQNNIQLAGFNLASAIVPLKTSAAGEMDLPLDPATYRTRRAIKVMVSGTPEPLEIEPNDSPDKATPINIPANINGRIGPTTRPGDIDVDLYRFEAKKGQQYVIETFAARRGSPVDTKIEVLHPDGRPVERMILKAVRDSYITFRGFDAGAGGARLQNWEEMELNQFLYLQGEVVKLFLAPRGPDSEYNFYLSSGKRRCYFDTSATAHALDEHAYIVEPLPPGSKFPPTGLPVIPLHYANDDDGLRQLGSDSRLIFTPPADGSYLVRVSDVRGFSGDRFTYRLTVREAKPDFNVVLEGVNPSIPAGSGRSFTVRADRMDGFEGAITVNIMDTPPGFVISTPLLIEAGHTSAQGTVWAAADAAMQAANAKTKLTATATIDGKPMTKAVNDFPRLNRAAGNPGLLVTLEPYQLAGATTQPTTKPTTRPADFKPFELTIAPGAMIPAMLKITRNGTAGPISFDVDNLPHGIIVADIGLSGVLIPEGQSERQIFISCAPNVGETDRLCHAKAREAGNPTSLPLLLHVRKPK
ncbi:MAG TPA: c-type cytochrome domain-containing protein [Tepidisphaeraceae bacterium]|nr:c-type cytochrome domain-containing protein [Tepidisphaeraceae bacterium]